MRKLFSTILFSLLLGSLVFAASAKHEIGNPGDLPSPVLQVFPERAPGVFDPGVYLRSQNELFSVLMAEHRAVSPSEIVRVDVTAADLMGIFDYKCETCGKKELQRKKIRCGVVKAVGKDVNFTGLSMAAIRRGAVTHAGGIIHGTVDGGFVWNMTLSGGDASAVRVHFSNFYLPKNTELYVYNESGQAFGPYVLGGVRNSGDFWSNTVSGPVVNIQVRHVGPAADKDLRGIHFSVKDLGYLTKKFSTQFIQPLDMAAPSASNLCPDNAECIVDASCYSGEPVNTLKDAVAYMQWVSGVWIYMCSGGLVADSDPNSQIPYFLTANHCISKSRDAESLECYFQYKTTSCGSGCYDPEGVCPRTLGAALKDGSSKESDFTLLQLWEDPPAGSVFLGWLTSEVAFTQGYELFRVSHPAGSPQGYSEHYVDLNYGTCSSWPRGKWIYSRDTLGATEGGSSGSPVTNSSAQIVGQLSGACGTNVNDDCDSENNATVDGAFANYFPLVQSFLGGGSTGGDMHVESIVLSVSQQAVFYRGVAEVTILDDGGQPVANAEVTGTFAGDVTGTYSGTTDANGVATIQSAKTKTVISSFSFCVDNVTHASLNYDSGANVETCDSY
jgi:hypothetical protein